MRAEIMSVGPVREATIEFHPRITLIGAPNEGGKSTIARCVGAALSGMEVPLDIAKKDGHLLVTDGQKQGHVRVVNSNGEAVIEFPECKSRQTGSPPYSGRNAAEMTDFDQLPEERRVAGLTAILGATITTQDLTAALTAAGVDKAAIDGVVRALDVTKIGMDRLSEDAAKRATVLKGAWGQITGTKWGSEKGGKWTPPGWTKDIDGIALGELEDVYRAAQKALDDAKSAVAFDAGALSEMEATAKTLPDHEAAMEKAAARLVAAKAALTKIQTELDRLRPVATQTCPCPACGASLSVRPQSSGDYFLEEVSNVSDGAAEIARAETLRGELIEARATVERVKGAADMAAAAVTVAREARDRAAAYSRSRGDSSVDIGAAEAACTLARDRLTAKGLQTRALAKHAEIVTELIISDLTSMTGVRRKRLAECLGQLNAKLAQRTAAAGWKSVEITPEMEVRYGGRPLILCSASARWRARAIVRLTLASYQECSLVILDAADILDRSGRNDLLALAESDLSPPMLVCMTAPSPDRLPDLAEMDDLGRSYWLQDGYLVDLATAVDNMQVALAEEAVG